MATLDLSLVIITIGALEFFITNIIILKYLIPFLHIVFLIGSQQ